jgi:hypothetical protein
MIQNFYNFINEEESAPRMPVSEEYWLKKGKIGKVVALYTHDDMDGIFCAIEMKKWLLNKGFTIQKYGILNYSQGWKYTTLDPKLINVVLDFANMPKDERDEYVDYYLDHHGLFSAEDLEKYKRMPVQKKKTGSAYEALCQALGVPQDELTVSVIDMIDSAKYQDYGVSWQRLLDFNLSDIKKSPKIRLEFGAAFNQFLKRSDTQTLISVIHNCNDASIYSIFNVMSKVYPTHNIVKGKPEEFVTGSQDRLTKMRRMTTGNVKQKSVISSEEEFLSRFRSYTPDGKTFIRMDGYQIIGDLVFIPTGTWANALRARTIIENDFNNGLCPVEPKFILLQYGGTLQVCAYKKISETTDLPVLRDGTVVDDLGKYMTSLLKNFQKHLGYHDPSTSAGEEDEITVSGGHGGIGSVSNIFGTCKAKGYEGLKFIDMFKNKIISDLSGVRLGLGLVWTQSEMREGEGREPEMNNKVIPTKDVTKVTSSGSPYRDIDRIKSFENFEYFLRSDNGDVKPVSKEEFIKTGFDKDVKKETPKKFSMEIEDKKVIGRFQ